MKYSYTIHMISTEHSLTYLFVLYYLVEVNTYPPYMLTTTHLVSKTVHIFFIVVKSFTQGVSTAVFFALIHDWVFIV